MSIRFYRAQIRRLLDREILPAISRGDFSVRPIIEVLELTKQLRVGKDFADEIIEAVKDKGYTVRYSAPHYFIYR